LNSLVSPFLLFHLGSITVSSDAVDPDLPGYRLFTIDGSLGETAPEKLAHFIIDYISMSILRFVLPVAATSSGKQLPSTLVACACPMQNTFHVERILGKKPVKILPFILVSI
jgi:hypothetical protein